jgi:hypothetical protein
VGVDVGFHRNPDVAPTVPDSIIDGLDLLEFAVAWGSSEVGPDPRYSETLDLNYNGTVDGNDLSYVGSQFGQVCLP